MIKEQQEDDKNDYCVPEYIGESVKIYNATSAGFDNFDNIAADQATPQEIAIAKIDKICPRCDRPLDDQVCDCGFSY